jgi:DNA polymerase III epsilon subunit-like protein
LILTQFLSFLYSFFAGSTIIENNTPIDPPEQTARVIFTPNNDDNRAVAHGTETDEFFDAEEKHCDYSDDDDSDDSNSGLDLAACIYVVFDLETTGLSKDRHHIIEIAAAMVDCKGTRIADATFATFIKPPTPIPYLITDLTGITNEDVMDHPNFEAVGKDFFRFIKQNIVSWEGDNKCKIQHIVFVAHNGIRFDIPFLYEKSRVARIDMFFILQNKFHIIDTMYLYKGVVKEKKLNLPDNYKLSGLYYYCNQREPPISHRAEGDVESTISILLFKEFWSERQKYIYKVDNMGTVDRTPLEVIQKKKPIPNDDSDTDEESVGDVSEKEDSDIEDAIVEEREETQVGWQENTAFEGVDSETMFANKMRSHSSTRRNDNEEVRIGLQASKNTVNSPMKAWRQIFTNSILDRIVRYTNEYGDCKLDSWTNIDRTDLTDFISVLFISAIQKRKDRISNWWSDNPLLENVVAKRIMTGRPVLHIHRCNEGTGQDGSICYRNCYEKQTSKGAYSCKIGQRIQIDGTRRFQVSSIHLS